MSGRYRSNAADQEAFALARRSQPPASAPSAGEPSEDAVVAASTAGFRPDSLGGYFDMRAALVAAYAVDAARLRASAPASRGLTDEADVVPHAYRLLDLRPAMFGHPVTIEARIQRDGSTLWAVKHLSYNLARDLRWEYEPQPSSRDDAFTARCRYATAHEALATYRRWYEADVAESVSAPSAPPADTPNAEGTER